MFDKNRIEHQADALDAWWKPVAYWFCWGLLGILAAGVVARFAGDV
jgi:hypothetical protein